MWGSREHWVDSDPQVWTWWRRTQRGPYIETGRSGRGYHFRERRWVQFGICCVYAAQGDMDDWDAATKHQKLLNKYEWCHLKGYFFLKVFKTSDFLNKPITHSHYLVTLPQPPSSPFFLSVCLSFSFFPPSLLPSCPPSLSSILPSFLTSNISKIHPSLGENAPQVKINILN